MLAAVAPGAVMKPYGDHYYSITYNGKTFPNFPKGEHGSGPRAEIKVGKVKNMIRLLGIDELKAYQFLSLPVKKEKESEDEKTSKPDLPPQSEI